MNFLTLLFLVVVIPLGFSFFRKWSDIDFEREHRDSVLKMKNYSTREGFILVPVDGKNIDSGFYLYRKDLKKAFGIFTYRTLIWLPIKTEFCDVTNTVNESYIANTVEEAEKVFDWFDAYKKD